MIRSGDVQQLLNLRRSRHKSAEDALLRQQSRCDAARAQVDAASARVREQQAQRERRELALLAGLVGQAVTRNEIEDIRITLAALDEHVACLQRVQADARLALQGEIEQRQRLAEVRSQRRREFDKLSGLAAHVERAARRRQELMTETEQEERVHGRSNGRARP